MRATRRAGRAGHSGGFAAALLACACAAGACAGVPPPVSASTHRAAERYANAEWGFVIDPPRDWRASTDFSRGYLANGAWKAWAPPGSKGSPVVAFRMPGSNGITDAEIRIGASRAPEEVEGCAKPPDAIEPGTLHAGKIGGTRFTSFVATDGAMSHRMVVHGYRVVHDGACYAIDLIVFGVNPEVFDPPATPPFRDADALARMRRVLHSFRFTR